MSAIESLDLDQSVDDINTLVGATSESSSHSRFEIVFIDENAPDYQLLVEDLQHSASALAKTGTRLEIVVIQSGENGLHLITDTLINYSNVDAVHLVSHGSAGNVNIGNVVLNNETFASYQSELKKWRDSFTVDGDLLIYGCEFASTSSGVVLSEKISAVVGVDIASSDDATGSQNLQADWQLEQVTGAVETLVPFSEELQATYQSSLANVIDVTTTADVVDGAATSFDDLLLDPGADGKISLREAIIAANIQAGADTINLPAGNYNLTIPGIGFDGPDTEDDIDITSEVTIVGVDTVSTIINNALTAGRVIEVHTTGNLTISDVTIQGGYNREGAGILNDGVFNASGVLFKNNNSGNQNGGGLKNYGDATVEYSDFEGNVSNGPGGGIHGVAGSSVYVSHTNFISNRSDSNYGGGIVNQGNAEIHHSSFYLNHSNGGGGLATSGGTTTVSNSTFSMNTAVNNGGGIFVSSGDVTVSYSTISENEASNGAGIHNESGTMLLESSIVAGNISTTAWGEIEVGGNVSSGGYNVIIDPAPSGFTAISSDLMGVDPQLQNYALHGGVTSSYALLTSSPAVNAANVATAPVTDQRDVARDATPDIGAYEFDNGAGSGDVPQLTLSLSNNTFLENTPLIVDSAVVITDIDSPDFNGGVFTVASTGITESTDEVYVNSVGAGVGEIDVVGTSVRYEGVVIGTWSGGVSSTPLQVTLNSAADATAVTALARNIAFTSTSEAPSLQTRTLAFSVSDGDTGTSSVETIDIAVTASNDPPAIAVPVLQPFINEIHYDNAGTDTGEGIEIAATAGTDLTGWTLSLYNGGAVYDTVALTGIIPNQVSGVGTLFFSVIPLQNGANDGIALVDSTGNVIEFLSYEGTTTAIAGPAAGMTSQDILVAESSTTPAGYSLQRTDPGNGFSWANASPNTFGAINLMQAFVSPGAQATDEDVALTFSSANGNSIVVSDADTSANLLITLSVSSGKLAFSSTPGAAGQSINFTGSLAQINNELEGLRYIPDPDFSGLDTLSISIDDQDNSNGTNETDSETIDIQVNPVNDAPYLDSASVLSLDAQSEDDITPTGNSVTDILGSSLPVDVITDVDSGAVEGIALTGIDNTNGIWQYSTVGSGWLAVPSVSDASALLLDQTSTIRFLPDPDYNGTSSIMLRAWDQTDGLLSGTTGVNVATNGATEAYSTDLLQATVNITPVADNPVVTLDADNSSNATSAGDYITTFIASGSPVLIADSDALLSDVDAPVLSRVDIKITNRPDGGLESLQADNFTGFINSFDSTTGMLVIVPTAGSAPIADFNTILKTVVYNNISNNPDIADRTVNVTVYDPDDLTDTATTTVAVVIDTTPPTVNINGVLTVVEGGQSVISNTILSSTDDLQAISSLNYTIVTAPASGFIAHTSFPTTPITQFTQDMIDLGQVMYVHNGDEQIADSFTFTVDDSIGNATSVETFNISVNAVNDSPVLSVPGIQIIDEDSQQVFSNAAGNAISGSDADATTVQITLSASNGTVSVPGVGGGSSVTHTISPSNIDSLLQGARYIPNSNYNGIDNLTVGIADLGQTGSGGANTVVIQIPITINAVNDAPEGSDGALALVEDQSVTLSDSDFGYSDLEGHTFAEVVITSTPSDGTLKLGGAAVQVNDVIPVSAIQLNQLIFEPDADVNGTAIPAFDFLVRDDGGTVNGGQNTDPFANTISLDIASVNDAPSGDNKFIAIPEDTAYVIGGVDFGYSDLKDLDNFAAVTITQLPSNGTLTLAGVPVTANQMISITGITGGDLIFTPPTNTSGAGYSELKFLVHDDGGTANGGQDISQTTNTLTFDVTSVNDAPFGTDNTISMLEGDSHVLQGADFGFSDTDDIVANNFAAVTVSQLPANGSLTLADVAVTANQLISITDISNGNLVYKPAPTGSGVGYSELQFVVHDDGGTANGGQDISQFANTLTFDVLDVNNAPSGSDKTVSILEDSAYVIKGIDFGFTDTNDVNDNFAAVTIAQLPSSGTLTLAGVAVTANQLISITSISNNDLVFTPDENTNGVSLSEFLFLVHDDGGTANGGQDVSLIANTLTFDIVSVNDAPFGSDSTLSILEGGSHVLEGADFGFSDTDDLIANNFAAVTVSQLPINGALTLAGVTVTANQMISITDISNGDLVYTPAPTGSGTGYSELQFQVHDDGGTANSGQDISQTTNTLTFDVTSVNDAPFGADNTVSMLEGSSHVLQGADFGFSDTDDVIANNFAAVSVSQLPANGVLTLAGVAVTANQMISITDISNGDLVYTPAPTGSGVGYSELQFVVHDDGGTANGGQDISQFANTLTFDVIRVNNAPSGSDKTVSIFEDSAYVIQGIDFGFTDTNDVNDNFAAVTITQLPSGGALTLGGVAVTANQLISITSINNNDLVFTPAANANGNNYSDFTFLVHDDGGTVDGGQDISAIANTLTFSVTAINDAPASSNSAITVSENTPYTFTRADFPFADAVDSDVLLDILIITDPALGSLLLNGQQLAAPTTVTASDLDNDLLTFVPVPNTSGANYASLEFRARDSGGTANGGIDTSSIHEQLIHVNDVNEAPAGVDSTITIAEDAPRPLNASDFGFTDPDQHALHEVLFFPVNGSGSLQFNGAEISSLTAVSIADINSGKVVFIPDQDENGSGYAAIDFLVRDSGGTTNGGMDTAITANTLTIDVRAVNDAPVSVDNMLSIDEDQNYVFTNSDFGFSDPIEGHGFEAVLVDAVTGAGTLLFNGVSVNGLTTISSTDIAAGSLEFQPDPDTFGSGYAAIEYKVKDSGGSANGGLDTSQLQHTIFIDVSAVNDAPIAFDTTITAIEDSSLVLTLADFGFADAENHQLQSLILGAAPANGVLLAAGVPLTVNDAVAPATVISNDLVYQPAPDSTLPDAIGFLVVDNGGTANGGADTSATPATINIEIVPVNDAPSGKSSSISISEDSSFTFSAASFGFSDIVEQHNFSAVQIVGASGNGQLSLNGNNIGTAGMISIADINAGLVEFTPIANTFGDNHATIDFRVVDDGGNSNGGADIDASIKTLSFDVLSVNDAPTGSDGVVVISEDTTLTLKTSDFGFSDIDNNRLDAVEIVSLPSSGALLLDGQAVSIGEVITANLINQGQLTYSPVPDSTAATGFDFLVIDDGGVISGGNNKDQTSNSLQINITAINDAPSGTDNNISLTEDTEHQFSRADFGFTDSDDDEFQSVLLDQLPVEGSVTLNGLPVNSGQIVDVTDLDSGSLVYQPVLNQSGSDVLIFRVQDDGGVVSGGQDTSLTANQIIINVGAVNHPPVGIDKTISIQEDQTYAITVADFGFSDVGDNHNFTAVTLGSIAGGGTLQLNGQNVGAGEVVTVADIAAGQLVYQSPVSTDNQIIGFMVHDNGDLQLGNTISAQQNFITFVVDEVNDAPVLTNQGLLIDEGGEKNISTADLSASDIDDTAAELSFVLQSLPENGVLTVDDEIALSGSTFTMEQLLQNRVHYIHNGSETSTDFFDFDLLDGGEDGVLPISSRFQIDVSEVIDPAPDLNDDSFSVGAGNVFDLNNGDLLATGEGQLVAGIDSVGDSLTISIQTQPEHGVLLLNSDGTFSYTHDGSANTEDSFTYRVINEDGISATATVNILVEPPIAAAVDVVFPSVNQFPEVILEAVSNEPDAELEVESLNEATVSDEDSAETATSSDSQTVSDNFLASEPLVDPDASVPEIDSDSLFVIESGVYEDNIDHSSLLLVERELKSLSVKKHAAIGSLETFGDNANLTAKTVQLVVDIQPSLSDIINGRQFQNSLASVSNDLNSAHQDTLTRYQIGNDVAVSVSISTTAGVLAWMLRGGALFGSLMAATPLWSAIDPLRISDADRRDKESKQDTVEQIFE